jgi:uncharacterized integral membrane protein (TIGR00697 family)
VHNATVYFVWIIVDLCLLLTAFTLWGRYGIIAFISATVVLMNIFVLKGIRLFGLDATGGNVLYASIFLGTDILAEYYGRREARRAVFMGFFISVLFLVASRFILLFTPADWDQQHEAMSQLFTPVWRVVAASMTAYLLSQNLDVVTYTWLKKRLPNHLWLRNNGSTWSSQIVDTAVFCAVAFAGMYTRSVLTGIMISTYLLKILVAAIDTPFIYLTRPIVRLRPSILERSGTR